MKVDVSRRKFAKIELADGLAIGGRTDSQVGSQVHAKVVNLTLIQMTCDEPVMVDLRWVAKGCASIVPTGRTTA